LHWDIYSNNLSMTRGFYLTLSTEPFLEH